MDPKTLKACIVKKHAVQWVVREYSRSILQATYESHTMGQKVNPISLRCPSPQKSYMDCWYSDALYSTLQLNKLKFEGHVQGILKQKGLPEGQIAVAAAPKSHRYLVCTLDPTESRAHKSPRYRINPERQANKRKVFQSHDMRANTITTSLIVGQNTVAPIHQSSTYKKAKAIHHALATTLLNRASTTERNGLALTYTCALLTHPDTALVSSADTSIVLKQTAPCIVPFFSTKYQCVASNVAFWTSGWESHHADFLAQEIAYALTRRVSFRAIKLQIVQELESNANKAWGSVRGIRVTCAGRGNKKSKKAQRAETVRFQWGQTSLHTFSEKVGFARRPALTNFGKIGVKVWVCYK